MAAATDPNDEETRKAVRLVHGLALAGLAVYLLVALPIGRDSWLSRVGRSEEVHFAAVRAETLDREAKWGRRPVVWLVGSSITREAFDADALRKQLADGGLDVGVEKYGFGRGAPVFTLALLDRLDVRPGDDVVTSVAPDNFRFDWLHYHGGFAMYLQYLDTPAGLWRTPSLSFAEKAEYSLSWLPPRGYWQYGESWRDGLEGELAWAAGLGKPPVAREHASNEPFTKRDVLDGYETLQNLENNALPADDLDLSASQVNVDALARWVDAVRARGAEPWVVDVPHNPLYYGRFADDETIARYHDAMASEPHWTSFPPRPVDEYMDYKHPNRKGRAAYTRDLADWLLADRGER